MNLIIKCNVFLKSLLVSHLKSLLVITHFILFIGFAFGAFMGLISASMDPQVGISPEKQTVKMIFQDFKIKTMSYGKNFAMIGAVFAAIECNIESVSFFFCY